MLEQLRQAYADRDAWGMESILQQIDRFLTGNLPSPLVLERVRADIQQQIDQGGGFSLIYYLSDGAGVSRLGLLDEGNGVLAVFLMPHSAREVRQQFEVMEAS